MGGGRGESCLRLFCVLRGREFGGEAARAQVKQKRPRRTGECRAGAKEELTKKGATVLRPFGNRTPGNNRYRCFLSDLAGLAARPPSGSRNS